MSKLVDHARRELILSGQYREDPVFAQSILNAVKAFASYHGHSGMSADIARDMLHTLLNYENLSPLTDNPAEWIDRSEESGYPLWQNNRNSRAFSTDNGKTYMLVSADKHDSRSYHSEEYHEPA